MRKHAIQVLVVGVLMVCLCAHVSELFDTWDHTLQTGNDIESMLVAVALCLGACVALVSILARLFHSFSWRIHPGLVFRYLCFCILEPVRILLSSSPPPLRV